MNDLQVTLPDECVTAPLESEQAALRVHPLYAAIRSAQDLRVFVEHHVVCVLDFMSLLKSLQRDLTCVQVPWTPADDGGFARLIHEIVIDEESDRWPDGRFGSHFEWYLEAMREVGADPEPILEVVRELRGGTSLAEALASSRLPLGAREFGLATAADLDRTLVERASVFLHGREEVIPEMFLPMVQGLQREGLSCSWLVSYLERHIEVDGGEHSEKGQLMLERLIDGIPARRHAAGSAARNALRARRRLWDAIVAAMGTR